MSVDILATDLAKCKNELFELQEKVRRWDVASEKLKRMVRKEYYIGGMQAAKDELFEAEAVLHAAVKPE